MIWEYCVQDIGDFRLATYDIVGKPRPGPNDPDGSIDGNLNRLGRDGWELVSATFIQTGDQIMDFWKVILKRPKSPLPIAKLAE